MIKVYFFAKLREDLAVDHLDIDFNSLLNTAASDRITVTHLLDAIRCTEGNAFADLLTAENTVCAINHQVAKHSKQLHDGDELAFYPPVTGG